MGERGGGDTGLDCRIVWSLICEFFCLLVVRTCCSREFKKNVLRWLLLLSVIIHCYYHHHHHHHHFRLHLLHVAEFALTVLLSSHCAMSDLVRTDGDDGTG